MKFLEFLSIIFLLNFSCSCTEERTYNMIPSEDENEEDFGTTTIDYGDDQDVVYGTPCYHTVNATYAVEEPSFNKIPSDSEFTTVESTTIKINARQDIPVIPLPPFVPPTNIAPTNPPVFPSFPTEFPTGNPTIPILPPTFPTLPQCCRNSFNLRRFYMISAGFPTYTTPNQDCLFVIYRSSPAVCRVRIIFKYFLIDQDQFGCGNNFIEIDGQRICGCKTNFVYESQWGPQPKVIRLRTVAARHREAQGFVFDVIQDPCPYRFQTAENSRSKRFLHHLFYQDRPSYIANNVNNEAETFDKKEGPTAKFFVSNSGPGVCVFNYLTLFQLKMESMFIPKQVCVPQFYL